TRPRPHPRASTGGAPVLPGEGRVGDHRTAAAAAPAVAPAPTPAEAGSAGLPGIAGLPGTSPGTPPGTSDAAATVVVAVAELLPAFGSAVAAATSAGELTDAVLLMT